MKFFLASVALVVAVCFVQPSVQKTECQTKREDALKQVALQDQGKLGNLAIIVPNCNDDGTYANLQCHHNSNFCQCWDKDGLPATQPKKNLQKCACMMERAKALKTIPPSQTEIPEITSCEPDGRFVAKQCDRSACWCVNPETGKKLGSENKDKSSVKC